MLHLERAHAPSQASHHLTFGVRPSLAPPAHANSMQHAAAALTQLTDQPPTQQSQARHRGAPEPSCGRSAVAAEAVAWLVGLPAARPAVWVAASSAAALSAAPRSAASAAATPSGRMPAALRSGRGHLRALGSHERAGAWASRELP